MKNAQILSTLIRINSFVTLAINHALNVILTPPTDVQPVLLKKFYKIIKYINANTINLKIKEIN